MLDNKVSIIMPTFNVAQFVSQSIDAILAQTYQNWELIIIDDCSTDDTRMILDKYSDSRITLVKLTINVGAGEARNAGIALASGRFIAFCDSDDIWDKYKLEKQLKFMSDKSAAISHTSFRFIDYSNKDISGKVEASSVVDLALNLKKTEIGTSTAVIDRHLINENVSFSPIRARQDLKLWISLLSKGHVSHGLDEVLVNYRVRKGSVSSNKIRMLFVTLGIYWNITTLNPILRLHYYCCYVFNAIKKRR